MNFKQAMEAADLFYCGLETSPFRYCAQRQPVEENKDEEAKEQNPAEKLPLKFNSISCYAHTWSNLAVLFLLMTTVGHSTLTDLSEYDSATVEREALMAA